MHYTFLFCVVYKIKMPLTVFYCHTILIENVCRLLCKSMLRNMFIKMCVKLRHIRFAPYVEVKKLTSSYGKHTSWAKSPWNYVHFLPESCLNSSNLDLGKMYERCNSFQGKTGNLNPKKPGRVKELCQKKLRENPEGVSHNFEESSRVKVCFLSVNWKI